MSDNDHEMILAEMDALGSVLMAVERGGDVKDAREKVLYLIEAKCPTADQPDDAATLVAMKLIAGKALPKASKLAPRGTKETDEYRADCLALAWMRWAHQDSEGALQELAKLPPEHAEGSGAVHRLCLGFWERAIEQLALGQMTQARRYYQRCMELGSQFGTESHMTISWTYAAGFFEKAHKPSVMKCQPVVLKRASRKATSGG
jgi:hypothetical protein